MQKPTIHPFQVQVISFQSLRRLIGFLGILLPWACWIANAVMNRLDLFNNPSLVILQENQAYHPENDLKSSISHFYYTASGHIFIGVLVAVAIFLFCYRGYDYEPKRDRSPWLSDRRVCSLAGFFALGVVVFPTGEQEFIQDSLFIFTATGWIGTLHFVCAALFFCAITVLCLVNFRRKDSPEHFGLDPKDWVYRTCGYTMVGSLVLIFIYHQWIYPVYSLEWPITFIFETVALTAFGIAWLVKGKALELFSEWIN